jgi:hypothetical protein
MFYKLLPHIGLRHTRDQALHSLSIEKKVFLPRSTLRHNWDSFTCTIMSYCLVCMYAPFLELVLYYVVVCTHALLRTGTLLHCVKSAFGWESVSLWKYT